jgi:cytidine deaminase
MADLSNEELLALAVEVTRKPQAAAASRQGWEYMGYVGSALVTDQGNVYTGVVVNLQNGIGFCAEHSAIAEMVKGGESRIARIAGATAQGNALSPCGRCREMMFQIDPGNAETEVLLPEGKVAPLSELLPVNWQQYWDK